MKKTMAFARIVAETTSPPEPVDQHRRTGDLRRAAQEAGERADQQRQPGARRPAVAPARGERADRDEDGERQAPAERHRIDVRAAPPTPSGTATHRAEAERQHLAPVDDAHRLRRRRAG